MHSACPSSWFPSTYGSADYRMSAITIENRKWRLFCGRCSFYQGLSKVSWCFSKSCLTLCLSVSFLGGLELKFHCWKSFILKHMLFLCKFCTIMQQASVFLNPASTPVTMSTPSLGHATLFVLFCFVRALLHMQHLPYTRQLLYITDTDSHTVLYAFQGCVRKSIVALFFSLLLFFICQCSSRLTLLLSSHLLKSSRFPY